GQTLRHGRRPGSEAGHYSPRARGRGQALARCRGVAEGTARRLQEGQPPLPRRVSRVPTHPVAGPRRGPNGERPPQRIRPELLVLNEGREKGRRHQGGGGGGHGGPLGGGGVVPLPEGLRRLDCGAELGRGEIEGEGGGATRPAITWCRARPRPATGRV